MADDREKLFNYKGKDICIRKKGTKYIVGITGTNGLDIWFSSLPYDSIKLAVTSGREYARIIIDKMLLSQRKEATKL